MNRCVADVRRAEFDADVLEDVGVHGECHVKRVRGRLSSPADYFRSDRVAADRRIDALRRRTQPRSPK